MRLRKKAEKVSPLKARAKAEQEVKKKTNRKLTKLKK